MALVDAEEWQHLYQCMLKASSAEKQKKKSNKILFSA